MKYTTQLSLITTLLLTTLSAEEQLQDITVTSATNSAQSLNDVTSDIDVITEEELEEKHFTTVTEALNSLPGINFTSNGGIAATSSLYLRGFDNQKMLVVIDGVRYNDLTSSSGALPEHLMISDIQQIEVLKGAQSGVWGADAAAGVIVITTKKAQQGLHLYATEEFGSFETSKVDAGISYANDTFYLKADHSSVRSQSFTSQAPINEDLDQFEDDGYKNDTTHLKAGLTITPTNKIDLSHTIIDTKSDYDLPVYKEYNNNFVLDREASANTEASSSTKTTLSSINFNHVDSFNIIDIYAKRSTFDREYPQEWTPFYKGSVEEYGLKSKIPYLGNHFVLWGGDYKRFDHEKSFDTSYTNKALFITNNNVFKTFENDTTSVTESLRHDRYSDFDNKTTGKVGLKHTFGNLNDLTFAANYGTAYNIPSAFQLYSAYGNPTLQPETIKGYDITLSYQGLEVTYFDNVIEDMINYVSSRYVTVEGKSKLKGYEISYNQTLGDTLMLSLGYAQLDAKDRNDQKLLRRPESSVKFAVDYYGIDQLHLGINGQYIGKRSDMDFATNKSVDTGKYTVANFVANYEVDKYLTLFGKIENITDETYQTVYGYASAPRAVYGGVKLSY